MLIAGACGDPECGQRQHSAELDVKLLAESAHLFAKQTGRLPTSVGEMAPPLCPDGGCVLSGVLRDPWGTPYRLRAINGGIQFSSAGRDRRWDTPDDISATFSGSGSHQ